MEPYSEAIVTAEDGSQRVIPKGNPISSPGRLYDLCIVLHISLMLLNIKEMLISLPVLLTISLIFMSLMLSLLSMI